MNRVAIITGGAGGMGLACAKILGKDHTLVICDLNQDKLDDARAELEQLDITVKTIICDICDSGSVQNLFAEAKELGSIRCVVHTAGISPQMGDPRTILNVNTLGTVNIATAALEVATEGFALVNVASMAGYMLPSILIPKRSFKYAFSNREKLISRLLARCRLMPTQFYRSGFAYAISKNFVIWYSKKMAEPFGNKGARSLSVSPGTFDTQMGRLEEKSGSAELLKTAALKRFGKPEEMAELPAFCASEKASYLTGTDILCDGGVVASRS